MGELMKKWIEEEKERIDTFLEGWRANNYCLSWMNKPVIDCGTIYSHYEPNGSKYLGIPQCGTCRKSNSYGQYGCPRLNRGLTIREAYQYGIHEMERKDFEMREYLQGILPSGHAVIPPFYNYAQIFTILKSLRRAGIQVAKTDIEFDTPQYNSPTGQMDVNTARIYHFPIPGLDILEKDGIIS